MEVQISVSPADFDDWPQLLGLLRESFAYMDARIDPPSSLTKMDIEAFKAKAAEEILILACEDRKILGCAFAALRDDCVYVGKLAVAAHARGRGIARAMVAVAEDLARTYGTRGSRIADPRRARREPCRLRCARVPEGGRDGPSRLRQAHEHHDAQAAGRGRHSSDPPKPNRLSRLLNRLKTET